MAVIVLDIASQIRNESRSSKYYRTAQPTYDFVLEQFPGVYDRRVIPLRRNAGDILTEMIAATPERFYDPVRRDIGVTIAMPGIVRSLAIDFFRLYVADAVAHYADCLEDNSVKIVTEILQNARKNHVYNLLLLANQKRMRETRKDDSWSIEKRVISFLRQDDRWKNRYVPILRRYMQEQ